MRGVEAMSAHTVRSYPRHTHDQYGIGMVDTGGHESWSGRGQVRAQPGEFICVNPGEVHDGHAVGRRARSWRMLYVEPALVADARREIADGRERDFAFRTPVFTDPSLRAQFDVAFRFAGGAPDAIRTMACETALMALVAALAGQAAERSAPPVSAPAPILRTRRRIDADPAAPFTLAGLAADEGLSRYRLIRSFARATGLPPHAYILQRRLELAKRLVRGGRSLSEAAVESGFYDQSHLTRYFVRQFGVTPRRYAIGTRAPRR